MCSTVIIHLNIENAITMCVCKVNWEERERERASDIVVFVVSYGIPGSYIHSTHLGYHCAYCMCLVGCLMSIGSHKSGHSRANETQRDREETLHCLSARFCIHPK